MEVHLTPELQAKLDRAAEEAHSAPDVYVSQLVENYMDHDLWVRQKVAVSLEKLDRGEYLTESAAAARLDKILQG